MPVRRFRSPCTLFPPRRSPSGPEAMGMTLSALLPRPGGSPILQKHGGSPAFSHELSLLCSEAEADSSAILTTNRS